MPLLDDTCPVETRCVAVGPACAPGIEKDASPVSRLCRFSPGIDGGAGRAPTAALSR